MKIETFADYAQLLPEEARDKYLANLSEFTKGKSLERVKQSIEQGAVSSIISCAFVWGFTPEGHKYWEKIEDDMKAKEKQDSKAIDLSSIDSFLKSLDSGK
jgi:hypothetical protein